MNYNNHNITAITYNGHTIKMAYGCDGHLVFGEEPPTPPTPTGVKFFATFNDGGNNVQLNCNSSSVLVSDELLIPLQEAGRNNLNNILTATIGDCVTEIEHNFLAWTAATEAVETLTSVTIADSVTTIGHSFCQGRTTLSNIDFPDGVTVIPDYCFSHCESLPSFNIKEGVTTIANEAFNECLSLYNIVIPSTVTSIGQGAFHCGNYSAAIDNNRTVTCLATTPPTLGMIAFSFGSGTATYPIYVPAASLQAYKTAWNGKVDANRIQAIE